MTPGNRTIVLGSDGTIRSADQSSFELDLGALAASTIVAELELLRAELSKSLTFTERVPRLKVKILLGTPRARARASLENQVLALELSATEIGYWRSYFLRYYRDGAADVDHLDLEADSPTGPIDFRMRVRDSKPGVSDAEARRRLRGD